MASNLQEIARDVGVREDALVRAQQCFYVWNGPPRRWTATYCGLRAEPLHEELHRGGVQPSWSVSSARQRTWDQTRPIRRRFGAESVTSLSWLERFAGIVELLLTLIVTILDIADIVSKLAKANNETVSAMTNKSSEGVPVPRYFPIRVGAQLREHMRALRKHAGLTQAQLGHRLGVGQARIAEIENNPAATSVEQFLRVLSTLGAGLVISTVESEPALPKEKPSEERKASRARVPAASKSRKLSGGSYLVSADPKVTDMQAQLKRLRELNPAAEVSVTSGRNFVIRAKKGTW